MSASSKEETCVVLRRLCRYIFIWAVVGFAIANVLELGHIVLSTRTINVFSTSPTKKKKKLDRRRRRQVENYKRGTGLLLNVHITHHGGTTFCQTIGRQGPSPTFACMHTKPQDNVTNPDYPADNVPWQYNETAKNVATVREFFHMISWEWTDTRLPNPPLTETNWEDPKLVSVLVMRDPMSRLLAGGADTKILTLQEWWEFAKEPLNDNYALKILAAPGCCDGENTSLQYYERAQKLIRRFTFVLDIACLDHGLQALANELGLNLTLDEAHSSKGPPRDRIGNDKVYEYLVRRNRLSNDLYEWSKSLSLVNCSAIP